MTGLKRKVFCTERKNEDIRQLLSNGLQLPEAMADDVLAMIICLDE